ncbi:hypothetical protein [Gordonia iterans]
MSEKSSPRPGEIWRYECPMIGDRVGVVGAAGRATMIDGDNNIPRDARPVDLIGYRAWCVDLLRSELEAGRDDPIDWNATCFLNEIAEREPWRVLREVDKLIRGHWNFDGNDSGRLLALADEFEREHAEKAKRDRLIEEAEATLTRIISGNVIDGYPRNAAAAILAEFPGVINALAEAADQ